MMKMKSEEEIKFKYDIKSNINNFAFQYFETKSEEIEIKDEEIEIKDEEIEGIINKNEEIKYEDMDFKDEVIPSADNVDANIKIQERPILHRQNYKEATNENGNLGNAKKCHKNRPTFLSGGHLFENVSKRRIPKCNNCEQILTNNGNYSVTVLEKMKPLRCAECDYLIILKSYSKSYLGAISKQVDARNCRFCEDSFDSDESLHFHIQTVHWKLKQFKCRECSFVCSQDISLKIHNRDVHGKLQMTISISDHSTVQESSLKANLQTYKCKECRHLFSRENDLKRHMLTHRKNQIPSKYVNANFITKESFHVDIPAVQEKLKSLQCSKCKCSFSVKSTLERHIQTVHKKISSSECDNNNSSTQGKKSVRIQSVHAALQLVQCHECKFSCRKESFMKIHMNTVHKKVKPFEFWGKPS